MSYKQKKQLLDRVRAEAARRPPVEPGKLLPLDYLLKVINDETANSDRRDRLAIAAAPYCHPKLIERHTVGIKDKRADAAEKAGMGTPWAGDLEFEDRAN